MNNYISDRIHAEITETSAGKTSLAIYMVILLLVLIAMATFRSPAVALMPDVTPKPLRSQANAIINLCGGAGGAIAFIIYTVALMFPLTVNTYTIIFASVAAGMLLLLGGFLAFVKERNLSRNVRKSAKNTASTTLTRAKKTQKQPLRKNLSQKAKATKKKRKSWKQSASKTTQIPESLVERKTDEEKGKLKSFWLILASIFMWFMGYNAISSNLSVYTTKTLNLSAGVASIISGVSMGISAIAFIPVGALAAKIGRRKSIMLGFALAVVSFFLIFFFVHAGEKRLSPQYCSRCFILSRASVLSLQTSTRSRWLPNFPPLKPSDNTPGTITPQRCPRRQSPRSSRDLLWITAKTKCCSCTARSALSSQSY